MKTTLSFCVASLAVATASVDVATKFEGFLSKSEAPLSSTLAITWTDCGGAAKIDSLTPSSVTLGVDTTITGSGSSPVKVSSGTFAANLKAGWIPIASCSGPIGPAKTCVLPLGVGSLTLNSIPLPIGPGPASISMNVQLSAWLPASLASSSAHVTATSGSGQELVCVDVNMRSKFEEFSGATPAPTAEPCTESEWAIVLNLDVNAKYRMCDENLGCFDGFGEVNKHCMETCLQVVGCSAACAKCVMGPCFPGTCDECHPTPEPTPATQPCTPADWKVVGELSGSTDYMNCEENDHCRNGYGAFNQTCVANCMTVAGISNSCAVCVVKFCHSMDCPECYSSGTPTPAPTPTPVTMPCSQTEWGIVLAIATNQKYWACDEKNGCWDGFGNMNKQCEIKCLESVGLSSACADCSVQCTSPDCTHCYDGPTPAPTPPVPTPAPTPYACTPDEWAKVKAIGSNGNYTNCLVNRCYTAYGRMDELCMAFCLERTGISVTCAQCIAERSGAGDWGECAFNTTTQPEVMV